MSLHTSARWLTPRSSNSLFDIGCSCFDGFTLSEIGADHELELGFGLVRGIALDGALGAGIFDQQVFGLKPQPVAREPGYRCVKGVAVFAERRRAGGGAGAGLEHVGACSQ